MSDQAYCKNCDDPLTSTDIAKAGSTGMCFFCADNLGLPCKEGYTLLLDANELSVLQKALTYYEYDQDELEPFESVYMKVEEATNK